MMKAKNRVYKSIKKIPQTSLEKAIVQASNFGIDLAIYIPDDEEYYRESARKLIKRVLLRAKKKGESLKGEPEIYFVIGRSEFENGDKNQDRKIVINYLPSCVPI